MTDKNNEANIQEDYERSRANYYILLDQGQQALDLAMDMAQSTEHPRAIEVLAGLIKNIADINTKLMDLNKKLKEINTRDTYKDPVKKLTDDTPVQNNNFFIGTNKDLQELLTNEMKDITPK